MDSEQIVLEVDDSRVQSAVARTNRGLDTIGDTTVRVSERSKQAVDRLIASVDKQAAAYGKSGVEKLIAQRDQLIARYSGEQRAVEAITRSYNAMIETERRLLDEKQKAEQASARAAEARRKEAEDAKRQAEQASHFNLNYAFRGIKDVAEGRGTFAAAEGFNVLQGLSGAPFAIGAVTGAFGALLLAVKGSAASLAEFGVNLENLKARTGIATENLEQFVFAAKAVGQDASIYERMTRGLSEALGEQTREGDKARAALARLGVTARDSLTGELKPASDVLLGISDALGKLPPGFERNALAMDLFKRAGIEALPVIEHLSENFREASALGLGIKDSDLARWSEYHKKITEAEFRWDAFKRKLTEPLAAVINVVFAFQDADKLDDMLRKIDAQKHGDSATPALRHLTIAQLAAAGARQDADSFIRSLGASQTPEQKLHDAESALSKLTKPELGVTSLDDAKAYQAAEQRVNQLKEQIKATNELTEATKRLRGFIDAMNTRELSPTDRLRQQLADFLAQGKGHLNPNQISRAQDATNAAIDRELTKQETAQSAEIQKTQIEIGRQHLKEWDTDWNEVLKQSADRLRDLAKEHIEELKRQQKEIAEGDRAALENLNVQAQHAGRLSAINSRNSGFGAEIEAAKQEFAIKLAIRSVELATIEAHAGAYDVQKERDRIALESAKDRYALEEQIAELHRKEFEEVQKTTEKLVNTLFTKPGNFSKELGDTVHAAILAPITHGISQTISTAITPVIYGKDGQSGINGALSGIFGSARQKHPGS